MVFFNYATMQMAAKIVYYGPGLCGKTTNLHHIYGKTAPTSRGEMISLETETDRTLFFDLLPIDVGVIGGFKTRLQLYTVPGQVFYNTTRKLVLRGVDGIVFIADSQRAMKDANAESFQNMENNLKEIGLTSNDIPLVVQFNKRDLNNVLSLDELTQALDPEGRFAHVEASALKGDGVFETLKEISKLTLRSLKKKMMGEEKSPRPAPRVAAPAPAPPPQATAPSGVVPPPPPRLRGETPEKPIEVSPAPGSISLSDLRADAEAAAAALAEQMDSDAIFEEAEALDEAPAPREAEKTREHVRIDARPSPAEPAPAFEEAETVEDAGPEEAVDVNFDQVAAAVPEPRLDAEVKHVKVRSNVDILSELEKLRKNATLRPVPEGDSPAARRRRTQDNLSVDDLLAAGLNHRKEVQRLFEIELKKKELARASKVLLTLRLDDQREKPIGEEKTYEIELSDMREVEKLLVSLKFHVSGK